jgi:hypothetical protein
MMLSDVPVPDVDSSVRAEDAAVPPIISGDVADVTNVGDVASATSPDPVVFKFPSVPELL